MSLTLHMHPLSSYCWKALIALYENATPFTSKIVNLGDAADAAAFKALWPIGKFPVLSDVAREVIVPESSIIIEYLARHYPGPAPLLPADPDAARRARLADRLYDLYVHSPMQKIVGDRLRPAEAKDPHGVAEARAALALAYGMIERDMAGKTWAMGEAFTLADCAAAPALYYANAVLPFGAEHGHVKAYLARLLARPSFARVVEEAGPYFKYFPKG